MDPEGGLASLKLSFGSTCCSRTFRFFYGQSVLCPSAFAPESTSVTRANARRQRACQERFSRSLTRRTSALISKAAGGTGSALLFSDLVRLTLEHGLSYKLTLPDAQHKIRRLFLTIDQRHRTNRSKNDLHVLLDNDHSCRNGSPRFRDSLLSEHASILSTASLQHPRVSPAVRMVAGHEWREKSKLCRLADLQIYPDVQSTQ
jgi:hypothetical protein